jgi:hypothetical protein
MDRNPWLGVILGVILMWLDQNRRALIHLDFLSEMEFITPQNPSENINVYGGTEVGYQIISIGKHNRFIMDTIT